MENGKRKQSPTKAALDSKSVSYDQEIYGQSKKDKYEGYSNEIMDEPPVSRHQNWSASKEVLEDLPVDEFGKAYEQDVFGENKKSLASRESSYHARRLNRTLSPERVDAFGSKSGEQQRSFSEVMRETQLDRERHELVQKIVKKSREEEEETGGGEEHQAVKKRRRWDAGPTEAATVSEWEKSDDVDGKPLAKSSRWDQTPLVSSGGEQEGRKSRWDETPRVESGKRNRWDQTPVHVQQSSEDWTTAQTPKIASGMAAAETPRRQRSRWDETPVVGALTGSETPAQSAITSGVYDALEMDPYTALKIERETDLRNRPWTDEELDALLPVEGYKILEQPASYVPVRAPNRKLTAAPPPAAAEDGFYIQQQGEGLAAQSIQPEPSTAAGGEALPYFKPSDIQFFGKLLDQKSEDDMSLEEAKERKIMRLLLRIKNGTPDVRKVSLKQITQKAREFGAGPLFNQILPLLMSPTLEEQERHLLVKVIDRILYKLDDLVRPFVHKILVVIEPLLIDEDYYARVEGREIISNLSKAAGLATMIATMRPDIDHVDEYVRNTTARAFSVVASALGIPALIPFLRAVCKSKKSWQARHTGIKIVQQIAILMGCAVLPHLRQLVDAIAMGLEDEQQKVRTMAALAISALAEASAPYGIESFEQVLKRLWEGIHKHRGKGLAAFMKAIGFIIPLMDPEYANKYTREIMKVLIREFQTPDEEMKKIVLKVIKQCCATEGVEADYIRTEILPDFFKHFWIRRMSLDRRNYKQLVETTVALAHKVGVSEVIGRLVDKLKDESEPFRKMTMETIKSVVDELGSADVDERLEEQLIDGMLFAFQEQVVDDAVVLDGFGVVVSSLGLRTRPYLPHICSTILWRLNNKTAKVRQQAADLVGRIAQVMQICGEEKLLGHLGVVLYEYLGEEFPDVLGSILAGLKGIVNVIGMAKMNPPIKDLLPRLTPILKNRHEKVQENCIDLVGRIADRGAEFVSAREWMRICFELLDTLKAHKKAIRRAAVNTFGYIAKAIGPQDVLATLLNNLKVQERQLRVCTTIAIAIVAETCAPFTVLPALMNEYRVPERNVQNGVLKSLSFMFEYIGEMAKDYIYSLTTLLEDALMDRDAVHRQTACAAIKHMSVGCFGLANEDALQHLLNYVWPNVFETAPHVINAVMEAIEGLRLALGPCVIMQYLLQGLFHPARKVRDIYWKIYNSTYLASCDSMVPYYPRIEDDDRNTYERYELDYVL